MQGMVLFLSWYLKCLLLKYSLGLARVLVRIQDTGLFSNSWRNTTEYLLPELCRSWEILQALWTDDWFRSFSTSFRQTFRA